MVVEDHPLGYPRQAAFADSDESFMIYRRFGYIHARLLLRRQDQLRELESELHDMDKRDDKDPSRQRALRFRDLDEDLDPLPGRESRTSLLDQLEEQTLKYGMIY